MGKIKKVLVTGADGFIGSHLTELLLEKGYSVRALAFYNSFNYWGWLEEIPANKNLEIVAGDIRDCHFVKNLIKDTEIVFHLAALIGIPFSYHSQDSYFDTNCKGTLNVCQAAKELGEIRVLLASTSEVYGTAQYIPIDEKHPLQLQSPYSASKAAAEAVAMSFYYSFGLPVSVVRMFNCYGPRQSARAIIPTIITQIAHGAKLIELGDMTPTRDFNYVKDSCRAFLAISQSDNMVGKTINVASNSEISVADIFDLIRSIMGSDVQSIFDEQRQRPQNSEVLQLRGDNTLITSLTDWRPEYSLDQGLRETINWFMADRNLRKYKIGIFNL